MCLEATPPRASFVAGFSLFQNYITAQIVGIFDLNNNQKNVFEFFLFVFHLFFPPFRFNE
jgi:hypothetical protein